MFTVHLSSSDPTAMPKRPLGQTHTLEAQRQVVEEATDVPGSLPLKKSLPTWRKRRNRRETTTPTTRPPLLNMSSTAPHSKDATSQTSTRAQSLSLNPVLHLLLLLVKKSGTANQTESPARTTTTTETETGTGTRSGGNATHRRAVIEEVEEEAVR